MARTSKRGTGAKSTSPAKTFTLAKNVRNQLPAAERPNADAVLWKKSGGLCSLCSRPLDPTDAEADHRQTTLAGGKTQLLNLYLAHKACNRARGALPFEVAQPIVEFKAFADAKAAVSFDDVLERYLAGLGKQVRQPIEYQQKRNAALVKADGETVTTPLYSDPATRVPYFFLEVPIVCIQNDREVQPRVISYPHVRALALDFVKRPVHEPSNCRLVPGEGQTAALLQFDGQHKTTAQILLGRSHVPMKVYVEPTVAMVQELVIKIQQEIKKQPLTRSDTLAKLGDVIKSRLEEYRVPAAKIRTETGFIASQASNERRMVEKQYYAELLRLVFFDEDNELAKQVKPGLRNAPTTDKVVIERIIKPLICHRLLDEDIDAAGGRDTERTLIVLILNTIAAKMLAKGWKRPGNELNARRVQNFFYQASIGWWMELLEEALRYVLKRIGRNEPLFIEPIEQKQRDHVIAVVETLCDLPDWSTDDEEDLKAMRSNTVKNVKARFTRVTWKDLLP